jgi:hypothetical protein
MDTKVPLVLPNRSNGVWLVQFSIVTLETPVPGSDEEDVFYSLEENMQLDEDLKHEQDFMDEVLMENKEQLQAIVSPPSSNDPIPSPKVSLVAKHPPPPINFGRPRRIIPPVPDYYGIPEEQAAKIDAEFDEAWAWAMEAAAPATAEALLVESEKRNRDRSVSSPVSNESRKPSTKSIPSMQVVLEESSGGPNAALTPPSKSKRKSKIAVPEDDNAIEGGSETSSGLSLPDIPYPQVILGELIEAEFTYCAHLDRMRKTIVPLLKAKLNSDVLANQLNRIAALHGTLLKAMTFTSEEEEDDQSLIKRVISALQIISSGQFKKTYIDFAQHSKRLHSALLNTLISQGTESNVFKMSSKTNLSRTQSSKRVNIPVGKKLFRKGFTSGEDLCKPVRHINNLRDSLALLVQSCEIYRPEELEKLEKIKLGLDEVTSDEFWKAQDDLLQTNYLVEAERQLRMNNIHFSGPDSGREVIRDGRVFKSSLVLKRLVPTRVVLFNDMIMWMNDETSEFMGFLVLSEGIRVSTDPLHPCQFQLLTEDEKTSKVKAICFQCKREATKSMWVYCIQRVLTIRMNQKDKIADTFAEESNAPSAPEETFNASLAKFINTNSRSPKDLVLLEKLGKGAFGEVYKAFDRSSDSEVAVKVIFVRSESGQQSVLREIEIQGKCKHPNIVQFRKCFGPDDLNRYWMVLSYCEYGSLFSVTRLIKSPFTENEAKYIAFCMLSGLDYLHELGVIHRDISKFF